MSATNTKPGPESHRDETHPAGPAKIPPPLSETQALLPRRFGRYVLFDQIGKGGMARIYLARAESDLGAERLLVLKQILPLLSNSREFSQLFIDEAKLSACLTHGNIVQVIDLGREDGQLYIAMEYVEGFDLRELLRHCTKHKVPLPLEFALLVSVEILRALDYAHKKRDDSGQPLGIVHRDVSPSNVLLSFEGEVKLCDFGIARAIGIGSELSQAAIRGKAAYMSPEAARGQELDARSDVFSSGIILWELLSGRRLYAGTVSLELAARAEIPELPDVGYPEQARLYGIVKKALAAEREQRFANARDMLRELEAYLSATKLMASPVRFGAWLTTHFGREIVEVRRARELAAKQRDWDDASARPAVAPASKRDPARPWLALLVALSLVALGAIGLYLTK
jgi:eukaryotic-like serine/threonine-protein kinase